MSSSAGGKADPADGKVNVQLLESNIEWESVE